MFDVHVLSENIKKYRKIKGLTQYELAEKLLISPQSVSKWECGMSTPDISNLCKISNILDISVDLLLGNVSVTEKAMIAVDGGGSQTEFILFNEAGKLLSRVVLSGCNPNYVSLSNCCAILKHGIDTLMKITSKISGIFIGASGFDCGNNANLIKEELSSHYKDVKIKCHTDIINVFASANIFKGNCLAATCSTGSVVYAYNCGSLSRYGGWGYMLENGGSAFGIGREALKTVLEEREGYGNHSLITEYIEKRLGSGVWESLPKIYEEGQYLVASFADEVLKAFDEDDAQAIQIIERCTNYLANRVTLAAKAHPYMRSIIISGSLIAKSTRYLNVLVSKLPNWLDVIIPNQPSIYGACLLCCKMCNINTNALEQGFSAQYNDLLQKNTASQ